MTGAGGVHHRDVAIMAAREGGHEGPAVLLVLASLDVASHSPGQSIIGAIDRVDRLPVVMREVELECSGFPELFEEQNLEMLIWHVFVKTIEH